MCLIFVHVRISHGHNGTDLVLVSFQIGSSVACGSGVKLSKFYYYEEKTDSCQAEIGNITI